MTPNLYPAVMKEKEEIDIRGWKKKYYEYLRSVEWKDKRKQKLVFVNNICEICGYDVATEVHHKTYKTLFNEPLSDLQAVCKECHLRLELRKECKKKNKSAEEDSDLYDDVRKWAKRWLRLENKFEKIPDYVRKKFVINIHRDIGRWDALTRSMAFCLFQRAVEDENFPELWDGIPPLWSEIKCYPNLLEP